MGFEAWKVVVLSSETREIMELMLGVPFGHYLSPTNFIVHAKHLLLLEKLRFSYLSVEPLSLWGYMVDHWLKSMQKSVCLFDIFNARMKNCLGLAKMKLRVRSLR